MVSLQSGLLRSCRTRWELGAPGRGDGLSRGAAQHIGGCRPVSGISAVFPSQVCGWAGCLGTVRRALGSRPPGVGDPGGCEFLAGLLGPLLSGRSTSGWGAGWAGGSSWPLLGGHSCSWDPDSALLGRSRVRVCVAPSQHQACGRDDRSAPQWGVRVRACVRACVCVHVLTHRRPALPGRPRPQECALMARACARLWAFVLPAPVGPSRPGLVPPTFPRCAGTGQVSSA